MNELIQKYNLSQLNEAIKKITYDVKESGTVIEDYADEYDKLLGSAEKIQRAINDLYSLEDKNDYDRLYEIKRKIEDSIGTKMKLPPELEQFIEEFNVYFKKIQEEKFQKYNDMIKMQQEEKQQKEIERQQKEAQEKQKQQELVEEIEKKLPGIKKQIEDIYGLKQNDNSFHDKYIELMREYNNIKARNKSSMTTNEDLIRLDEFSKELEELKQKFEKENKEINEKQQVQTEIKQTIENYDARINDILETIKPYMTDTKSKEWLEEFMKINSDIELKRILAPEEYYKIASVEKKKLLDAITKVNDQVQKRVKEEENKKYEPPEMYEFGMTEKEKQQVNEIKQNIEKYDKEIDKMIEFIKPYINDEKSSNWLKKFNDKNSELDSKVISNPVEDYKTIEKEKKDLVDALTKVYEYVNNKQEDAKQETEEVTKENKEVSKENEVPDDFLSEFSTYDRRAKPETRYNPDGTMTYEYMAYIAMGAPESERKIVMNQLMEANIEKRRQLSDNRKINLTEIELKQYELMAQKNRLLLEQYMSEKGHSYSKTSDYGFVNNVIIALIIIVSGLTILLLLYQMSMF